MKKVKQLLPANRVVLLMGVILSITAFLTSLETSFVPGSPGAEAIAKALVCLGAVLSVLAQVLKFLDGSQKYDALVTTAINADRKTQNTDVKIDV